MSDKGDPRKMNAPLQDPPEPRQQEAVDKLAGLFKGRGRTPPHEPIIKSLEKIGLNPKVMPVTIGGEEVDCIVMPIELLMLKEYQYMSGVDVQGIFERSRMARKPQQREEQEDENECVQPGTVDRRAAEGGGASPANS
jgi:hypothetical protein